MIYRLANLLAINSITKAISKVMILIQVGVGVQVELDVSIHYASEFLTDPASRRAAVSVDFSNALNSRDMVKILSYFYDTKEMSDVWSTADSAYSNTSPLWLRGADGRITNLTMSESGSKQRDVFVSMLNAKSMK